MCVYILGYGGMDRNTDGTYGYNNINASYHFAPNKLFINTEGCSCPGVSYNDWLRAERLGHDILFDLLNYAQGWIDWNLLVDSNGGPNHLNNMCDASIITTSNFTDIHIQPKYFYFGHFSKFLTPNAVRMESHIVGNFQFQPMDPLIQPNLEIGMFPCEQSVRQMWAINPITQTLYLIAPSEIVVDVKVATNSTIQLCVAYSSDPLSRHYLRLVDCHDPRNAEILLQVQYHTPVGQLVDMRSGECISLADDVRESGALLALRPCHRIHSVDEEQQQHDDQYFMMILSTGEIYALLNQPVCLTAGWPMLNTVSFLTETDEHVTILMNEASVSTTVTLIDVNKASALEVPVPARSIQTVVYQG